MFRGLGKKKISWHCPFNTSEQTIANVKESLTEKEEANSRISGGKWMEGLLPPTGRERRMGRVDMHHGTRIKKKSIQFCRRWNRFYCLPLLLPAIKAIMAASIFRSLIFFSLCRLEVEASSLLGFRDLGRVGGANFDNSKKHWIHYLVLVHDVFFLSTHSFWFCQSKQSFSILFTH